MRKPVNFCWPSNGRRSTLICTTLWLWALLLPQTSWASPASSQKPIKILFIGDSFTESQGGIFSHIQKLRESDRSQSPVLTARVTVGGATLKRLWELGDAVRAIDSNRYDIVVVQDDIPEINVDYFKQYATLFVNEIRQHHARPVIYMTWAYQRLNWITMAQIADAHRALARELKVDVAPVGLAWARVRRERPAMDLMVADREHPSPYGMYLGTCVVYATIFNRSPSGLTYAPPDVSASQSAFLQHVAWRTVTAWQKQFKTTER